MFAAFRLPELTRYPLWYDEVFSLTLAQQDWAELLRRAVADRTNPPLFYALLKAWIGIGGESVAWMRLLPCLCGILVAVPLVALARRWLGDLPAAFAAGMAAAASPLAVFLANELRGYSLLLLLATLSCLAFARLTDDRAGAGAAGPVPPLALLVAVNVALVYAHYFGWLVVGAEVGAAAF
ncbi:MAG TPA: glycosyltransferase family 39 protein, partial [Gemmatimonadaceae bacterium]|nr:glycosyltransferase family 39 protein [Gemmatimonadaceae bacterium]